MAPDNATPKVTPLRKPIPCPICKKPSSRSEYPFCSHRCRDVDLNRWLKGGYSIPAMETDPSSDDETGSPDGN